MSIEEAIDLLENDHVENDIEALAPKDRLNFWASLKEFHQPKLQRALHEPIKDNEFEIKIVYADDTTKTHESIQKPLGDSEKD